MFRKASVDLEKWYISKNRKPLIIRGARQVGKSYLTQEFARKNQLDLIEVNLEKIKISELENTKSFSIEKVLSQISLLTKKKVKNNSLLFIDEIQQQPKALNALRYFYEEKPELSVITAGSLLETTAYKEKISMPVGRVNYLFLGPMSFFEFLEALGEDIVLAELQKLDFNNTSSTTLYEQACDLLKLYYYIGGLPEAVQSYKDNKDLDLVRDIHYELLQSYKDDISKYANKYETDIILNILDYLAANLGKKVIYSKISKKKSTYVKEAIKLLCMAGIIDMVPHTNCSGLPLSANKDSDIFKLYFLDVGLYNTLLNTSWSDIYSLSSSELLIKGNLAEQFISQHLLYADSKRKGELYYWLRGKESGKAEVDFVFSYMSKIYPIEVKSGKSGKMRSLWQLVYEKRLKTAFRFDLSYRKKYDSKISHRIKTKNGVQAIECNLIGLPLYLVEKLEGFCL